VLLALGGFLSLVLGFAVGYQGLESSFQEPVGIAFQLVVLVFTGGLLVISRRAPRTDTGAPST
jgi:hypothetical protein